MFDTTGKILDIGSTLAGYMTETAVTIVRSSVEYCWQRMEERKRQRVDHSKSGALLKTVK